MIQNVPTVLVSALTALICSTILVAIPSTVSATVGGPTLVEDIVYDDEAGQVYFKREQRDAKGQVSLRKFDPETEEVTTVTQAIPEPGDEENMARIEETIEAHTPLSRVNLEEEGFTLDVELRDEPVDDYNDRTRGQMHTNLIEIPYRARLSRDDDAIEDIEFFGCAADQEVVIDALDVPNTDHLLLRISTTTQCFEHGYVGERIIPVADVELKSTPELDDRDLEAVYEEKRGGMGALPIPHAPEGSVSEDTGHDEEEIVEYFRRMSEKAKSDDESVASAAYLWAIWHYAPRGSDIDRDPSTVFDATALYVEGDEIEPESSLHGAALPAATSLLQHTEGDEREKYARKLATHDRFAPLRGHPDFAELLDEHGLGDLVDDE